MMNTQRNWLLIGLVALGTLAPGCRTAHSSTAERHSLWKVSGAHATVYLLGSIHLFKKGDYPLAAPIESAFTNAGIAVFETDIGEMERRALQPDTLTMTLLPAGESFRDQLSPQTYARLTNSAAQVGVPLVMLESLRPVMAAFVLVELECKKLGFEPENGIDLHYYKLAREAHKTILPLETVDFQLKLLTSFSKEEDELLVKSTLDDLKTLDQDFAEILRTWKSGDAPGLEKVLNSSTAEAPAIFKRLVTDRSARWVPKIEELCRGNTNAIVIVGAAHLVGKDGVVELLRKRGLKVRQE